MNKAIPLVCMNAKNRWGFVETALHTGLLRLIKLNDGTKIEPTENVFKCTKTE